MQKGHLAMKNRVPHNILTLSDLSGRTGKLTSEVIPLEELRLNAEMLKKLRGSSSRSNKSIYVRILIGGERYNVERVTRRKDGRITVSLISPTSFAVIEGEEDGMARLAEVRRI